MTASRARGLMLLASIASCGDAPPPAPLADLPAPAAVDTERFADALRCAQCHVAGDTALRDAAGRDVSPVARWRPSMMALAARDPLYLAGGSADRAEAADPAAVDALCTRCHAPAGSEEARVAGGALSFDDVVAGDHPAAVLAREGVTCTACHQIAAAGLGEEAAFSGGFRIGFERALWGPIAAPLTGPMGMFVRYTPTYGPHILDSALCGTCHVVIVPRPGGGELVEQATYLEWRSSSLAANPATTCQGCHVPTTDEDGAPITTRIASFPDTLSARPRLGRHDLVGGNAWLLRRLAGASTWLGAGVDAAELEAAAQRTEAFLGRAATLAIARAVRTAGGLEVDVVIENQTGHKLPTGYPTRRVWIEVVVRAGDAVVFQSGGVDARGALGASASEPHHDRITRADEVQIYEAVFVDGVGRPTSRALVAHDLVKDNRILPSGWAPEPRDALRVAVVGVSQDPSFQAGRDTVTYAPAGVPEGALTVEARLWYAPIAPPVLDELAAIATPAGARLAVVAADGSVAPVLLAGATASVP